MSIIIISRGAHHRGGEVAEKTAQELGFPCLSRDILLEASNKYDVPEVKLKKSMERAPNFFERLGFKKEKYIAYMQSALLNRLKEDNLVYHGLAAHFFLKNISHVLLVRINVDIQERVKYCMKSEKVSEAIAYEMLAKLDAERKKWGLYLYGIDITDPDLYDLVLKVHRIDTDEAAEIIISTAAMDKFKTTPASQQAINDLALAAEVKANLMKVKQAQDVSAHEGIVSVQIQCPLMKEGHIIKTVEELGSSVIGVREIRTEILPYIQPAE